MSSPKLVVTDEAYEQFPFFGEQYEVLSVIGQGGMGTVYKVWDASLRDTFAIKVLSSEFALDPRAVKRFEQEAESAASLSHAHLVSVYGHGETDAGAPYLVMDYVPGASLATILRRVRFLSVERGLEIFIQIAQALIHAHGKGVVHRDLKPSNLLITKMSGGEDFVKIIDFGIAKVLPTIEERTQVFTQTNDIFGSPLYMSPEQCQGDRVDARSDIYSFGCLMYETLTGIAPFAADNAIKIILKHINERPAPISTLKNGWAVPAELDRVILHCLEREPSNRYQSTDELMKDLVAIREKKKISLGSVVRRRYPRALLPLVLVCGVGGLTGLAITFHALAPEKPDKAGNNGSGGSNSQLTDKLPELEGAEQEKKQAAGLVASLAEKNRIIEEKDKQLKLLLELKNKTRALEEERKAAQNLQSRRRAPEVSINERQKADASTPEIEALKRQVAALQQQIESANLHNRVAPPLVSSATAPLSAQPASIRLAAVSTDGRGMRQRAIAMVPVTNNAAVQRELDSLAFNAVWHSLWFAGSKGPETQPVRASVSGIERFPVGPFRVVPPAYFGRFSIHGPISGTLRRNKTAEKIPGVEDQTYVSFIAYDAASASAYSLGPYSSLLVTSLRTNGDRLVVIPKEFSVWPTGITFDSRRRRLLLIGCGGEGLLYSYAPNTGAWQSIAGVKGHNFIGLGYCPFTDRIYTFENGKIYILSAYGTITCTIVPSLPIPSATTMQLIPLGKYLVLVADTLSNCMCYVLDANSGHVYFSERIKLH